MNYSFNSTISNHTTSKRCVRSVQLVSSLPSLQIIDDLQNVSAVLVLSWWEVDLFVFFNVWQEIVINRLEALVECFKVVSCQHLCQFLNILKVSIFVVLQLVSMIRVVPSWCNGSFNSNTVFSILVLEALVNPFELLNSCLQRITSKSFVLCSVRRIPLPLSFKNSLLLL